MRNFLEEIKNRVLIYDGSKGYMLQKFGLKGGECPELWNLMHSDVVRKIHKMYKDAGSDVIQTNTFSGNRLYLEKYNLGDKVYELNYQGAKLAKEVMGNDGFVAGAAGPTGELLEPVGRLSFDTAYNIYKEQVEALVKGGADMINFETFTDVVEMRAALLAAKENVSVPVICSLSFEQNGKTIMGTDPKTAVIILKSLGADMVGTNCSFGPELMLNIVKEMYFADAGYLSVKPNAGLPEVIDGVPVYCETPKNFVEAAAQYIKYCARLIGGCCGTTPEYIKAIKEEVCKAVNKFKNEAEKHEGEPSNTAYKMENETEKYTTLPNYSICKGEIDFSTTIASSTQTINLNNLSDEKIGYLFLGKNKNYFRQIREGNMEIVAEAALDIASENYSAVYINLDDIFEDNEIETYGKRNSNEDIIANIVIAIQEYIKLPFIFEASNPAILEKALRIYAGRAGVVAGKNDNGIANSDGKLELNIKYIESIIKKYGAVLWEPY